MLVKVLHAPSQRTSSANPPTLFLVLADMARAVAAGSADADSEDARQEAAFLEAGAVSFTRNLDSCHLLTLNLPLSKLRLDCKTLERPVPSSRLLFHFFTASIMKADQVFRIDITAEG